MRKYLIYFYKNRTGQKGFSIIEILVVVSILSIGLLATLEVTAFALKNSVIVKETNQAAKLATETAEAVRNFRDGILWDNDDPANKYDGLGVVTAGAAYHTEKSTDNPPKWQLIVGAQTIDGFSRQVVFINVSRDPTTQDIETSYNPVNNDSNTKKATITITWGAKSIELVTYFTNFR